MTMIATLALAATIIAQAGGSMSMGGHAMSSSMMAMPKCAAGDHVVGMNTMTKMYLTQDQMKTKMAGMSMAKQNDMMMKNHVKMMCKSKADAMGAKMMKG